MAYAHTYYVDNANGNDGNDGLTEGNAWATLEKAADTVAVNDRVFVQSGTDYTVEDGANDCLMQCSTDGTHLNRITFEGYTTSPGDDGIAVLDANSGGLSYCIAGTFDYYNWHNIQFTGAGSGCLVDSGADANTFNNCEIDNAGASYGSRTDNYCVYYNCRIHTNSSDGVYSDNGCIFINCKIYDNGDFGVRIRDGIFVFCEFFGNTNGAAEFAASGPKAMIYCTVDGETIGDGILLSEGADSGSPLAVLNNIFHDLANGLDSDHVDYGSGSAVFSGVIKNNLFFSNTADTENFRTGDSAVTADDPDFTDEGAHDYTLDPTSPAIDAGYDRNL